MLRSSGFFARTSRMQINRKFNATELSRLPITKPPNDLQKRFEKRSIEFLCVHKARKKCTRKFETLFETLLHRAFSGELTVKWREGHTMELLAEMKEQAKYLPAHGTHSQREDAALQESLF